MYTDMEWLFFGSVRQFLALWDSFEEKIQNFLGAHRPRV